MFLSKGQETSSHGMDTREICSRWKIYQNQK